MRSKSGTRGSSRTQKLLPAMQMAPEPYPATESKVQRLGHLNKIHNNNYTAAASVAEFHGALAGYRTGSRESDRRSNHSGAMSGKTADARGQIRDDQLTSVQEMVSHVQDAPGFYYSQAGEMVQRTRAIRHQPKLHKKGAGGHRTTSHHAYLLEGPALARQRDPASKLSKAMNLVYNN